MENKITMKNIVYGNISAGGNVHVDDIIYYNVEQNFKHSILFFRIEKDAKGKRWANLTLKSPHHNNLENNGLGLFKESINLEIDEKLFARANDFQNLHRRVDENMRRGISDKLDDYIESENQLSQLLFDNFFKGDILTVCNDFVDLLEKRKIEELIIAISAEEKEILNLPFEMLIPIFFKEKLNQERQSLAVSKFGFVRTMEKDLPQFNMQVRTASAAPLKMLFVTALPENLDEKAKMLEIEEEQKRLIDAIGTFEATGGKPNVVIEFLDTASLNEIEAALSKHQHDILHISGHGSYDEKVRKGVLHLEDDEGNHQEVSGATLGEKIRQHQCVKLLILSACETAITGNGVVEELCEFGIPALVAMRYAVTDEGAKIFTTALYQALAEGKTLTFALATARQSLWTAVETKRKQAPQLNHIAEWFTPVVYINQYMEKLIDKKQNYELPKDFYHNSNFLKTKNTRLIGSGFIGRKRYLNMMRRCFGNKTHVVLQGLGGMGKTTLAEAFAHNYDNRSHDVIIFRNETQIAEKAILDKIFGHYAEKLTGHIAAQLKEILDSSQIAPLDKLSALIENVLQHRKTILIFDNFEDVQNIEGEGEARQFKSEDLREFLQYLLDNAPDNCHVLITTRYVIPDLQGLQHIAVDKMSYAESYRLSNFSATLRQIPLSERQDVFKRFDGHPRAYEFLEAILKNDKQADWNSLAQNVGKVEAKVWENLLLEKIYVQLDSNLQGFLQMTSVCITRTPIKVLETLSGESEYVLQSVLKTLHEWSLCYYDSDNQTFEVHRLTREWMQQNILDSAQIKQWAYQIGNFYKEQPTWNDDELSREYFEIAEAWEDFAKVSFGLQNHYQLVGFNQRAFELNQAVLEKNVGEKSVAKSLFNLGAIKCLYGQKEQALQLYEQSRIIFKQINDRHGESVVLNGISQIYHDNSDYDSALRYLEQSLAIKQQIGDNEGEGRVLNNISQIHHDKGDYDSALRYLEQSLTITQQIGDSHGEGTILNNISTIYYDKGDDDSALRYLEQSLAIAQQIGDLKVEGNALNNINHIYFSKGDYDSALDCLVKSLTITQQIGDSHGESMALNNIGQIYFYKGNNDIALRYFEQSLNIAHQAGNYQTESVILNNISQIYFDKGDYDRALGYLEQGCKIAIDISDKKQESVILNRLAEIAIAKCDYDSALHYLNQSLAIAQQTNNSNDEGKFLNNISQIYKVRGDYDSALRYLEQSLVVVQQIGDTVGFALTLNNIGAIYFEQKNDIKNAITYLMQSNYILHQIGSPNTRYPVSYLNGIIEQIGEEQFNSILSEINQQ